MCAGLTVYKGLKESGARPGQCVVIVGAGGGLGTFALQYGKAIRIICIAVDAGEDKAQLCKELGAVAFIDYKKSPDIAADLRAGNEDRTVRRGDDLKIASWNMFFSAPAAAARTSAAIAYFAHYVWTSTSQPCGHVPRTPSRIITSYPGGRVGSTKLRPLRYGTTIPPLHRRRIL